MRIDMFKHLNRNSLLVTLEEESSNREDNPRQSKLIMAPDRDGTGGSKGTGNWLKLIKDKLLGVPDSSFNCGSRAGLTATEDFQANNGHLPNTPNGTVHVVKQNGGKSSTLPRSTRRHTAHVSFDQIQEAAAISHNKSILKSPVKLVNPPGRIEVIKEEVEFEVATNSRLRTSTTMHRSVEGNHVPPPVPPPKLAYPSSQQFSPARHSQPGLLSLHADRNDFPIYSEPVIVPTTVINKQPRLSDYNHESLGSRLPSHTLNDDDPGVMSEADTSGTSGFRRGGRARASLPIVSKTLEKPLGVVFLQFRDETKRSVLPNEVTTLDTVKALFVRAFPKHLTMQYLDRTDKRKIYILDQRKDMFYELEDLRDIRDRSVLKIFESDQLPFPGSSSHSTLQPNIDEISYYSEPEFDTFRYSKNARPLVKGSMSSDVPPPPYISPPNVPPKPQRSSFPYHMPLYEEPIYANMPEKRPPSRSGTATPIVDEEARYRVDAMERHLATLTGLVQQALGSPTPVDRHGYRDVPAKGADYSNVYIPPKRNAAPRDHRSINAASSTYTNGPTRMASHSADAASNHMHLTENGIVYTRYPDPMLMEYLEHVHLKVRDMRSEARALRRHHQSQALTMREIVKDNFERIKNQFNLVALPGGGGNNSPRIRSNGELQIFQQDGRRLDRDLRNLESDVEDARSSVMDGKKGVGLRDVERFTGLLNDLSNNVSDMRLKFPDLQEKLKAVMTSDMEMVIRDEMFIKEEPEKLEDMAKRCRKLTGTLLSLNKLACIQEPVLKEQEILVDLPPEQTNVPEIIPQPPTRRESLANSENSTPVRKSPPSLQKGTEPYGTPDSSTSSKRLDKKAQDMLDDLLSELEVFTDVSSREPTPDRDSTIKRSPKNNVRGDSGYLKLDDSLSPPSITPSNSSQSTNTTMSSMTETSSNFSGSDSGTTISKVQVGVGDAKTTVSPVPLSTRSGASSGLSTPARKGSTQSDSDRNLTAWLNTVNLPAPPPRSTSKSPIISPLSRTGGFFTLPSNYRSTVSEPGDYQTDYANLNREARSPSIKDQRLTPQQQDRIASYYTSKLRKNSIPGSESKSPIDDIASDIKAFEANKHTYTRSESGSRETRSESGSREPKRVPPALPPKPGQEDPSVAPPLPPRTRQEALDERHQELLRKQKQLQEQYARLQQLQRDQKLRPSSPLNKPSTTPQSGSLNDLKRQHFKVNNDLYAVPSSRPLFYPKNLPNGGVDVNKICETDIL